MQSVEVTISNEEHSYSDSDLGYCSIICEEDADRYEDPTGILPGTDDYAGPLNFQLFLNTEDKPKKSWLFSTVLKKLYIDINKVVCIQFKCKQSKIPLLIRALPVYSTPEFLQEPVTRCPVHIMADKENGYGEITWLHHVLRAEHHEATYHVNRQSKRHSVTVPLRNPGLGSEFVTIMYKFTCKTSCAFGLNRRLIHVIFTLETQSGEVVGRRKILVKVCSCPKRDLQRDEMVVQCDGEETQRKKRIKEIDYHSNSNNRDNHTNSNDRNVSMEVYSFPNKEIKLYNCSTEQEDNTNKTYTIPSINVVGKKQYISTLELLHGHFLGLSVRNDCLIDMHPIISQLSELLDKIKES